MRATLILMVLAACSGDDNAPCLPDTNLGCTPELQCETVQGRAAPTCLSPVVVTGKVFDVATHSPVNGARVVLQGTGGVALAAAATTAADGSYAVRIHAPRDATFMPVSQKLSVEVEAPGYGTFPDRWRPAPLVDALNAQANADKSQLILASSDTNVFLLPFGGGPGIGVLSGTVPLPASPQPILVVASAPDNGFGAVGVTSLVDAAGAYKLFGLPPANYTVSGYAKGLNFSAAPIALSAGEQTALNLRSDPTATSKVSGKLQVAGGGATGVALFVAATYDAKSAQGDEPVGLSTTSAGDGTFSITGVPSGSYAVVASPDNDGFAATSAPPVVTVTAGMDATIAAPIAVAPAVPLLGPGANAPEAVGAPPTLTWQDVAAASSYHVTVTSGIGAVVWERDVAKSASPAVAYGGSFAPGGFYKFHVDALDSRGDVAAASEDLRGIFYQPGP
jgi:hypothetical protein